MITLTETAKEIIQKWQLTKMPSITVIPCCADTNHFKRENVKEDALQNIRLNFGLDSTQIVLGYLGAIGTWYMLDEMLDFFKVLLKTNSSAKFLFVTNEASETILNSAAKRNIPVNTLIITSASRQEVPLFISLMSVSIFFIKPTFSKQASSPTKMAELLSMGIPVIANSGIGDSDRIIEKTDCGIICQEMNEASYASAISTITSLLQKQKTDLRQVALDYFSLKMGAERYSSVYKSLTNNFLDTDRIRINL